ncbi:MAG: DUF4168 domain-containing protein [Spirulinaceae cyanobacterium SM2_1_0]|nr:DUF4168 domain-containing protein [Spirulinaceae cyanobacterium SM2_1_0]
MLTLLPSRNHIQSLTWRSLSITALTALSIILGGVPDLGRAPTAHFDTAAQAQGVSDEEIRRYAQALLEMEPQRVRAYNRLQDIVGNELPNIVCNQTASFSGLPGNARQIASSYCNQSRRIVRDRGFTVTRFNQITQQLRSDEQLRQRVQAAMRQLQ